MAITITRSSASIGTTEYFLASDSTVATYQTTDCVLQVFLDVADMVTGDELEIKFYEKIDGTNATVFYRATLIGAQSTAWVSPAFAVGDWEVSCDCIAGTTITVDWQLVKLT